jgi:membrane-associated phospholipid phosphatase
MAAEVSGSVPAAAISVAAPDAAALGIAQWLGAHALGVYALLTALALAATVLAWRGHRRLAAWLPATKKASLVAIGAPIAAGFGVILFAAWLFAELADALNAGPRLGRIDQAFTGALAASVPTAALRMLAMLTHLGDPATLTALCVAVTLALMAAGRRGLALGWFAAVAGNALLNTTLKQVFARVRPLHDGGLATAHGFSFPSGHSSGSLVTYCMLAYLAVRVLPPRWHLPACLVAVALALTVGASRVFLRVHYASDVVAGFASGTAWLAVCVGSVELARWVRRRRPS